MNHIFARTFGESARIRVLMLAQEREKLTEQIAGLAAQIRWLELEQWPFYVKQKAPTSFSAECAI